jgi:hypothetical protein
MIWARMLAYITGTVDQELLLRNEYLAAEDRILRAQIKGRLLLAASAGSDAPDKKPTACARRDFPQPRQSGNVSRAKDNERSRRRY